VSKAITTAKLRKAVYEASKAAFSQVLKAHSKEKFYVFGLMTNDAAQYLYPLSNTEQALKRTLKTYHTEGYRDTTEDDLRWSFGDWAYSKEGEEHFESLNEQLALSTQFDDWDDDEIEEQVAKLMKAVVAGLADLEQEGFFGEGTDRLDVAVMIVGDIDQGLVREWIEKLNPPEVAKRFDKPSEITGRFQEIGPRQVSEGRAVSVSARGDLLVSGGDYHVFAWQIPGLGQVMAQRVGKYFKAYWGVHTIAVSPDGSELAIGWKSQFNDDGGIERWSIARKKKLNSPPVLQGGIWTLDYAPNSNVLASGGADGVIRLWELSTCELISELKAAREYLEAVRFSPDACCLAAVAREHAGRLTIWDPKTGKRLREIACSGIGLAFTPDGKQVAVACGRDKPERSEVPFWDVKTGKLVRTLKIGAPAEAIAFSSDGRKLAVCSALPGRAEVWDLDSEQCVGRLDPGYTSLDDLAFIKQDSAVALVGWASERRLPLLVWELD
jgi:hypothetical protein